MSEKTYTERELVLAKREAFVAGSEWHASSWTGSLAPLEANDRYPLPRVTRPRVVRMDRTVPGREFRVSGGNIESRTIGVGLDGQPFRWTALAQITPTPERIRILADLLANPTEEVEDDA